MELKQLRQRRHGSPRRIAAGGCRRRCSGSTTAVLGGGSCGGGRPAVAVAVAASGSTAVPGGGSCVGSVGEAIPAVAGDGGLLSYSRYRSQCTKEWEDNLVGVIREVLADGSCSVALGSSGNGEIITALPSEIDIVLPRKSDKIKIMGGAQRRTTWKLIGVDGTDGIVKIDDILDVKILDMVILAKLAL
nr:putative transcription elongation factor SPT5 homolog 1 isoform X1 [Ipomoea trifida]